MTVTSPVPQKQQLICSVILIQWIVAWIIYLCSYAIKEKDKLVQQNNCTYLENIKFIWSPVLKHTFQNRPSEYMKGHRYNTYSNAFLASEHVPLKQIHSLNQLHSIVSNILEVNLCYAVWIACNMQTESLSTCWYSTTMQQ